MVLTEKQIKKVQGILKKVGPFKMRLGYDWKNWLEDMESATTFFGCPNLRKACIFAALDSSGRVWWNSVHNIQELNYAQLCNNFLEHWCPESFLQPTLKAYADKRVQGKDETISEF